MRSFSGALFDAKHFDESKVQILIQNRSIHIQVSRLRFSLSSLLRIAGSITFFTK